MVKGHETMTPAARKDWGRYGFPVDPEKVTRNQRKISAAVANKRVENKTAAFSSLAQLHHLY